MARTLADCLDELKNGGEISEAEWRRIRDAFEDRVAQQRLALGDEDAARQAAEQIAKDLKAEALEKRRRAALTAVVHGARKQELQAFRAGDGRPDVNEAALRLVQRVEHRMHAIEGQARAMIAGLLDETRRKITGGIRNKVLFDAVVRAAHGDADVSNEARGFASALDQMFDWLRQRFNAAGGAIGQLDSYFPHWHDPQALRKAGFETWRAAILHRLDPVRTGMAMIGRAMSEAELDAVLPRVFDKIASDGWTAREPAMRPLGRGMLATRHADHRSLHFKSGADWLAYNADFGGGSAFEAMQRHVHVMARDTAALELLSPNPDGMIHWLRQVVVKAGEEAGAGRPSLAHKQGEAAVQAAAWTDWRIASMWAYLRGEATAPVHLGLSEFMGTLRSANVASKLGGTLITSVTDLGTQKLARLFNGLHGSVLADITNYLTQYRMSRDEAARAGLLIDSTLLMLHDRARYAKAWAIRGLADWAADRVLAVSGLTPYTHAGRHVFGFAVFAEVADHAGKSLDQLPAHLKAMLERHGIDRTDWDVIRAAPVHAPPTGLRAGFIRPTDVMELASGQYARQVQALMGLTEADEARVRELTRRGVTEIATKYLEMVFTEMEYAVPTATVRARTLAVGGTRPGSVPGEILRSVTQFRMYPLVYGLLWGQRIADQMIRDKSGGSWHAALSGRGGAYAAGLFATVTLLGALAWQLKNIRAGRDPEDMTSAKFWGAAVAQGGGFGIFGDFVFADHNRFGNSLGATIAGPSVGMIEDMAKLALGPIQSTFEGKETKFGKELVRFVDRHAPGGNIWYLDLAAQRLLFDNLQRAADPKAAQAFARQVKRRQKERGQAFWWSPGEDAPARAPDLSAVLGTP